MARYPAVGAVKTRLAKSIGAQLATDLYRAFLLDIQERFADGERPLVWMYDPPDSPFAALMPAGSRCYPQQGTGLGERMRRGFECLLSRGDPGFERVIMIGADIPHVRAAAIDEAEQRLRERDVVLGPSEDGGYYLIALRQPHDLFSMVEMGTSRVLEQTLGAARTAGLSSHLLAKDFDIDEEADLARLRRILAGGGAPALLHTRAILEGAAFGSVRPRV